MAGKKDLEKQRADEVAQAAIAEVGEEALAAALSKLASGTLQLAVSTLHGTPWWTNTLKTAIMNKSKYDSAMLCKLLDKLMASPQAVKIGAEEGFKIIIEHATKDV